ncbi:malto-oligosyltrehalose synthase [Granulicoccus sp. GXG6511]|uniref:malto-oligosyltrehalose synthase n=1 Tax=Granulicoccus sp. GXG6511 TaxID=3381351 RepID=UPI003D7D3A22
MIAPTSTYRLQIRPSLTLQDAAELTDYLVELGVDAVYLSPVLTATTGSDHGYDTVDPTTIDPARGGEEGWRALVDAARAKGLKIVLDIVPNHLGISVPAENPAWWSVLAQGRDSAYASWFDIDWNRAPILVPVLGDDGLDAVTLETSTGAHGTTHELRYHEHRFPVAEGTYAEGDSVADVHARQHYRLAHWETGATELNYRRFFAVTTLAGVRQEDPQVRDATHARILQMIAEGDVDALRVDHPDGLVDPKGYFEWLAHVAPGKWLIAEKILEHGEQLPANWPIHGTSGYDAMTEANQVFVDPAAEETFTRFQRDVVGDQLDLADHILLGKTQAGTLLLPAELDRLVALVPGLPAVEVREALVALTAHFEVYRSYVPDGVDHLRAAADAALRDGEPGASDGEPGTSNGQPGARDGGQPGASDGNQPFTRATMDALVALLADPDQEIARRFQQYSGAVMAKGVEDTAYYRANRFIALNEVGGNPAGFGMYLKDFHTAMARRQERLPDSMTALSTHDTKRGEDVRARLAVLAELGDLATPWLETFIESSGIPNRSFANLLGQTLLGAGPIDRERLHAYAEKAMREAADGTTWTHPAEAFERRVHAAVDLAYDDENLRDGLERLWTQIEQPGWANSLGQKLVQLTMPGVPDVYQGTELWEDSLVDPDNRRPVDFEARRRLLGMTEPPWVDETGAAKFWVVRQALRLRRERPELFGSYAPVLATGTAGHHLLAFDRGGAITAVTRFPYTLSTDHAGWGDTQLPLDGVWRDVLTGVEHNGPARPADLFQHFPVALLVRD